jgi:phosphonate transport system substrate-binding protein
MRLLISVLVALMVGWSAAHIYLTNARPAPQDTAGTVAEEAPVKEVLRFGIISTETRQGLKEIWAPFLEALGEGTGYEIESYFAPDYAGVIEAMRFGKVDVAWFGNKSAIEAVDRANGEVFAQSVDVAGRPGYWSILITRKGSGITYEDVLDCSKRLTFGNGDPNSTSGFLIPSFYVFAQNNIDPRQCYEAVRNANHETNALAVANGQVDFATNNTENIERLRKINPEEADLIEEIWRSPLIPDDPMVWRKDLDPAVKAKVLSFFMGYGRHGTLAEKRAARAALEKLTWAPFRPSSDAQLYPVRQLQLFREKTVLLNDERLDADERARRIAEIDARLAEIDRLSAELP